jgi:hypothetical protein
MAKLKLITEYEEAVQVNESDDGKYLFIEGVFSSCERENKNGRKYKKETMARECEKLQDQISRKCLYGELNHPASPDINLERAAILVTELKWKGNDLLGKAKVLDTPMGRIAKTLIKEGSVGISSRGLGSVKEDGYVDDKSYRLITWDLVGNPSNHPSWVRGVYEGREWDAPTDEQQGPTVEEAQEAYKDYLLGMLDDIKKDI